MAKHPHLIQLIEGRTWRCMLEGCSFFVHMGLKHVMLGKRTVCFECKDHFTLSSESLNTAMMSESGKVKCDDCIEQEFDGIIAQLPKDTRDTGEMHERDCPWWREEPCTCKETK